MTRRAALAAFLLFAAALFVVGPADASRTSDDRSGLASSSPLELASLERVALVEPIAPVESSSRFGFAEDLGLLDPEAGPGGFVVFAAEAAQCELTYARNNPLKYVDPDGKAIALPLAVGGAAVLGTIATVDLTAPSRGGRSVILDASQALGRSVSRNFAVAGTVLWMLANTTPLHSERKDGQEKPGEKPGSEAPPADSAAPQKGERAREGTAEAAQAQLDGISAAQSKDRKEGTGAKIESTGKSEQRFQERLRRITSSKDLPNEYPE